MPSYFQSSSNAPEPQDGDNRLLHKICASLYDALSSMTNMPTYFQWGSLPESQDGNNRLLHKICGLLNGLAAAIAAGGSAVYLADNVASVRALTTRYSIVRIPSLGWDFNWVEDSTTADDGSTVLIPDDITHPAAGRYERFI